MIIWFHEGVRLREGGGLVSGQGQLKGDREEVTTPESRVDRVTAPGDLTAPRLLVLSGDRPGRSVAISGPLVIGRGHDADLRIDQQGVSRTHARIWSPQPGTWSLQDLDSRNGTYVNGVRAHVQVLRFGDRIQLANDSVLLFTFTDPGETRAVETDRLASVSHVAATVAHDFNNLVGVVLASLDYLADGGHLTEAPTDSQEALDDARTAAREARDLAKRLLSLGRPPSATVAAADLSAIGRAALKLIRRLLPSSVALETDLAPRLFVEADRDEVHQVLVNLCVNARDAMPDGGTLTLTARRADASELPASLAPGRPYALCQIRDTGIGMNDDVRSRIFTPFFTTKNGGRGTGLGLAMVQAAVKNRGGGVEVQSSPGEGTTVTFFLPTASVRPVSPTLADSALAVSRPSLRIALGELDPLMLRSTRRVLKRAGHEVLVAATREDLLALVRGDVDAVLIDTLMLGDHIDAVEEILSSGVPVVAYGHLDTTRGRATRPLYESVAKPATAESVEAAIARARILLPGA